LISPYIDKVTSTGNPTLDDPRDVYETDLTVHFRPAWMAVVDIDGTKVFECKL
jgi:hypothetical protein